MAAPDAILSVRLQAEIDGFNKNLATAGANAAKTGQTIESVANTVSAAIGRLNSTGTSGLSSALNAGASSAKVLGAEVSKLSTNISRNIASFDKGAVDRYIASLNSTTTATQTLGAASTALSTNISRNIAAFNGANISRFVTQLNQTNSALATTATVSTSASRGLAQMAVVASTTGRAVTSGSNSAAFALTNLGRVAQDAPFGFIGIQNNLNPLLESFQRLRAETGSNGAAFRALGQSLIGPAGIGIALSVITSAITFYMMYQQRANKTVKDAKKNTDDYIDSLGQLAQVQVRGAVNAQKDITVLDTLYGITQNTTISLKQRTEAVNELQSKYPDYFKNLKDETILNGGAKDAYDRLTVSIIATAKARAAQDLITKNSSRQLENEQKIIDLETESNKLALQSAKLRKDAEDEIGGTRDLLLNKAIGAEAKRIEIFRLQNNLKTDSNLLDDKNLKLTEAITAEVKKGADLTGGGKEDKQAKGAKSLAEILKELNQDLAKTSVQFQSTFGERNEAQIKAYQSAIDAATKSFGAQSKAVQDLRAEQQKLFQLPSIKTGSTDVGKLAPKNTAKVGGKEDTGILANLSKVQQEMLLAQAQIYQAQDNFNKDFNELVQSGLVDSLSSIGEAIGTALIEGGDVFSSIGNSLLAGFGQFLSQFGKLLVEYGAAAILKSKLDAAILIPGAGLFAGAAAIAAGIALQVAAAAFGSLAGKGSKSSSNQKERVTAFAEGGIISGPTLGLMGEYSGAKNNPEVVAPLSKLKSMIGNNEPFIQVIPIANSRELAVLVRNGNKDLSRQ